MSSDRDLDIMTKACIEAGDQVIRSGSPELQAAMRILLYILAGELTEHDQEAISPLDQSS